ncbi:MAG: DUF4145 domain-containing protein [Rickettsiales bacterium]
MYVDKSLWQKTYDKEFLPLWPCSRCGIGHLHLIEDTFRIIEPYHVELDRTFLHEINEIDARRFCGMLSCTYTPCKDIVSFYGNTSLYLVIEEDGKSFDSESLEIQGMFPAPDIFKISDKVPKNISKEMRKAFRLYWVDNEACANKIRNIAERILDWLNVPKEVINDNGKPSKTLNARIKFYSKNDSENADLLDALREIGNVGSHGQTVYWSTLLDSFDVSAYVFEELFLNKKEQIKKIRDRILMFC